MKQLTASETQHTQCYSNKMPCGRFSEKTGVQNGYNFYVQEYSSLINLGQLHLFQYTLMHENARAKTKHLLVLNNS